MTERDIMDVIGIDVGGSGIKGAIVNTATGKLLTKRIRIETPEDKSPDSVINTIAELIDRLGGEPNMPVGVGLPLAVVDGVPVSPFSALNIAGWVGEPIGAMMSSKLGVSVKLVNDADAAGLAEVQFGAGQGVSGIVLVITLGTGVGSGMFYNGNLIPNMELGKLFLKKDKHVCERRVADSARKREALNWSDYAPRVNRYLTHLETLFTPQLLIIGGGASKKFHKIENAITIRTPVVPATLLNNAGIVGAAMAAS